MLSAVHPIFQTNSNSLFGTKTHCSNNRINITIRRWDSSGKRSKDTPFTLKPDSQFRVIFRIYAVRESEFPDCLGYFKYMVGDRLISEDDCPQDASVTDGDCIDAIPCIDDPIGARFV
jgi:hypothetical protein